MIIQNEVPLGLMFFAMADELWQEPDLEYKEIALELDGEAELRLDVCIDPEVGSLLRALGV